jgi:hypothetical protein
MRKKNIFAATLRVILTLTFMLSISAAQVSERKASTSPAPKFSKALAFSVSPAVRNLATVKVTAPSSQVVYEVRPDRGPVPKSRGFAGDAAVQKSLRPAVATTATIPNPSLTFEGLKNTDNPFLVAPPDPVGAVGLNQYVEMVNLVFAVYDKQGNRLAGPTQIGNLWQGFAIPDCTDLSGDPIVIYDKHEDRWLLTQFTTRGPTFYNCVAISQSEDATGAYFLYAFSAGTFFPDYPKYGTWSDLYLLTSRDFGPSPGNAYGISVYGLERDKMLSGDPTARSVHFFLDSAVTPIYLMGDGLLPADIDGDQEPSNGTPAPIVGTMDQGAQYGAPFDALNIYELTVDWQDQPIASLTLVSQLPVAEFDSTFPCNDPNGSRTRSCIPQPGTTRRIDILSYRQRPTWRLAYRKFDTYEAMVTNQSVQASPGMAGVRWYEIRRTNGQYSIFQQGTYAPNDGVHRWMGSIAMDQQGNMALGYSVSNATAVFPGIRYTGRLSGDPAGQMTLGEASIIEGSGSQLTRSSRWGDYTSMNVDPVDDCTFWYVNEYYTVTSLANWQTRIGSFTLPGCHQ